MKIVKGDTVEKQIKHIDLILARFSRKLHKTVIGVVPPIVIPFYYSQVEAGDTVLRFITPVDGTMLGGAIFIEEMEEKRMPLSIKLQSGLDIMDVGFEVKLGFSALKKEVDMKAGGRISVVMHGEAKGVWLSLAFEPTVGVGKIKRMMIDELDRVEEENTDTSTEAPSTEVSE
jgi:hypothetical protein